VAARILRWAAGPAERLEFSHALVRQALLDQLSPRQRATMHRRAAQALEVVGLRDSGPYLTRLAGHYVEAAVLGDQEPAIRYSAAAAAQATRTYAFEEAARHLGTAVQLMEHEPGAPPDSLSELQLDLADAQWRSGATGAAVATYRRALELADKAESPQLFARAALGCCVDAAPYAERPDLVALLDDALRLLPDEELTLRSAVLGKLSEILIVFEAYADTALSAAETAVEMARQSGSDAALSRGFARHG